MSDGLGYGRKNLVSEIVKKNWNIEKPESGIKKFSYNELLFVIQEMLNEEGKHYFEHKSTMRGHYVFREFMKLLLYRNVANYDSMVLLTSEKGCLTDDTEIACRINNKPIIISIKNLIDKGPLEVLSYNIKEKIYEYKLCKNVEFVKREYIYELILVNSISIKGTGDHPFLLENGTYKQLKDLKCTDKIITVDGNVSVDYIRKKNYMRKVYDVVGVKNNKNFVANGVVVSNTGKSSAAIMMAREWCSLIGIQFNPSRHMAYNNADVMNKIDSLNKFEPIICVTGDTRINIKIKDKETTERIDKLVGRNDFKVLSYNENTKIFEYQKPEKCVKTSDSAEVYKIELENGLKIKVTANHRVLTKTGYKKLCELTEEDELMLETRKCIYCGKEFYNNRYYVKTCSTYCSKKMPYRKRNNEAAKKYYRDRYKHKMKTDILFRLTHNLQTRTCPYVNIKTEKGEDRITKIIGCSIQELKTYLENKFTEGMSWENYGGHSSDKWSMDHIIPICHFDLSKKENVKKCFHYTNMQPLWNNLNSAKGKYSKKPEV